MADKPITRLASEMATKEQKKKRGFFDKVGGFFADAGQEVGRMVTNPLETAQRVGSMAKETFVDPIVNLPNAFDPTSGLSPLERVNTGLGGGLALADAFTPFMPEGALANALANRAASKAWANHAPAINRPKLSPGQGYGLHVSHIPDLPVIKDIAELRNKGTNFGTPYDSTQWTPPGATYVFGIPQGQPGIAQVNAAVQHAQLAKRAAANNLDNPEIRDYIMYLTRTNPLELPGGPRLTRVADPEYGTHNAFTDGGQSVVGDQKILSVFDLDLNAYDAPRQALDESPLAQAMGTPENQLAFNDENFKVLNFERDFVDNLYNRVSLDPEFANYLAYIERMQSKDALQKMSRARLATRKEAERAAEDAAYRAGRGRGVA